MNWDRMQTNSLGCSLSSGSSYCEAAETSSQHRQLRRHVTHLVVRHCQSALFPAYCRPACETRWDVQSNWSTFPFPVTPVSQTRPVTSRHRAEQSTLKSQETLGDEVGIKQNTQQLKILSRSTDKLCTMPRGSRRFVAHPPLIPPWNDQWINSAILIPGTKRTGGLAMFIVIILIGPVQMKCIPRNYCLPPLFGGRGHHRRLRRGPDRWPMMSVGLDADWSVSEDNDPSDREQERHDNRTFIHFPAETTALARCLCCDFLGWKPRCVFSQSRTFWQEILMAGEVHPL